MIKIGLVGFGYWGRNLARVVDNHKDTELSVICDLHVSSSDFGLNKYKTIQFERDYKLLLKYDIDAVLICTPTISHFEISEFFAKAGKHVFCEKPLATSITEVNKLADIVAESNKVLMVGHIFEFNPVIKKIKSIIEQDELGEILYISMVRASLGPIREDVNVVFDLITHDISILNYLLEESPLYVNSVGSCFFNEHIEDIAFVNLTYKNKLKVNIQASWLEASKERKIKIVGTKQMLVFNDIDPSNKLKIYETGKSYQKFNGDFGSFQLSLKDGDIFIPNIDYQEPLQLEFNHFVQSVLNGTKPTTDVQNAWKVVDILEKIQKSLK